MKFKTTVVLSALALASTLAGAQQGVSKTEITLGSIQDLSGPIAGFGKQARLGMLLRVDEINEQGGINGRKLKLIVEDSAYGYTMIDILSQAAQKAGPTLTTDSFVKAMDAMTIPPDIFGAPQLTYTARQRLGSDLSRLSQIQDGKWKVVSDYVKP